MKDVLPKMNSQNRKIVQGSVVVSPNLKKTKVFIDAYGNHIDPVTKQIIKLNKN